MKIDEQLRSMGFTRTDTGGQVFNYVRDVGNGLSLVCHSEAGGMPDDRFAVWFGVSFTRDFVSVCGQSFRTGAELADWLSQSPAVLGDSRRW